ncbi:PREDICTED: junctional adhesion molecule A-like [Priapulus caudatus]|uniref:Junctional adhesion molecule A-like n=1 Tax=Priapulus caudatus TaxID=37621 RepID=A0ABM1E3A7_PRICU|nr:PREDICTED: junctional adhesion molecule A-like [Priapulus caudatus]
MTAAWMSSIDILMDRCQTDATEIPDSSLMAKFMARRYSEHTRSRQRRGDVIEAGGEGLLVEPRLEFQSVVPPNEVDVNTYESISLECHAGGSPPAKIHWLKDGERIIQGPSSDDAHVESYAQPQLGLATTNSRLVLDCVTSRDAGMYSCVAETAFGRIRTDSLVQITGTKDSNKVISSGCPAQKRKYGMPP